MFGIQLWSNVAPNPIGSKTSRASPLLQKVLPIAIWIVAQKSFKEFLEMTGDSNSSGVWCSCGYYHPPNIGDEMNRDKLLRLLDTAQLKLLYLEEGVEKTNNLHRLQEQAKEVRRALMHIRMEVLDGSFYARESR
jgi:hypothetical protein